jgi:membrane protein YqaA with SNARE-associated domain
MDWISLGLFGLFLATFISATVIPLPSEGVLIACLAFGFPVWQCLIVATIGNTLGGLTNYGIGLWGNIEKLAKRFKLDSKKLLLWEQRIQQYGIWLGLLAWLPIFGDPMVAALGFFRVRFWPLTVTILLGKLGRYAVVIWGYYYLG